MSLEHNSLSSPVDFSSDDGLEMSEEEREALSLISPDLDVCELLFSNLEPKQNKSTNKQTKKSSASRDEAEEGRKAARNTPLSEQVLMDGLPYDIDASKLSTFFKKIRGGVPLGTALSYAKISKQDAKIWFEAGGNNPNSWYGRFLEEYNYCTAQWEIRHIQKLMKQAGRPNNWKLNLKLLELQRADSWAPVVTTKSIVKNIQENAGPYQLQPPPTTLALEEAKMLDQMPLSELDRMLGLHNSNKVYGQVIEP